MITPLFEVEQDESFVIVKIRAPYIKASSVDFYILETMFKVYAKPYFLRLVFEQELIEDGRERAQYDISTNLLTIWLPKKNAGEVFQNLDMITKLLSKKETKITKDSIQIVPDEGAELDETRLNTEGEGDDEAEIDWEFPQEMPKEPTPEELLRYSKYGFNQQSSGAFEKLDEHYKGLIELPNPDNTKVSDRRLQRIAFELDKFDEEHYAADFMDDNEIKELIGFKADWETGKESMKEEKRKSKAEATQHNSSDLFSQATEGTTEAKPETKKIATAAKLFPFTEDERYILCNLANTEYVIQDEKETLLGLGDIILAYAYNCRVTQGESNVESSWTISRLSSTLAWFDVFTTPKEVAISFVCRSLCYPLYRNWILSQKVLRDAQIILSLGKRYVLKCLLSIRAQFEKGDFYYLLNRLYIDHYCVWLQSLNSKKLSSLAKEFKKVKVTKKEFDDLDLIEIEQLASQEAGNA